ncbi:MAG: hypothetical protein ACRDDA_00025, partial [Aeromonas sp.]
EGEVPGEQGINEEDLRRQIREELREELRREITEQLREENRMEWLVEGETTTNPTTTTTTKAADQVEGDKHQITDDDLLWEEGWELDWEDERSGKGQQQKRKTQEDDGGEGGSGIVGKKSQRESKGPEAGKSQGVVPAPTPTPKTLAGAGLTSLHQRMEHQGDKYGNWALTPERPILFLGDSNVTHIPEMSDARYQVVAYPGAQLAHAYYILKHRTPTSPEVQKVVCSFGINNRGPQGRKVKEAVTRLLGAAEGTFPNAEIKIPVINFSDGLPTKEKKVLQQLNDIIRDTGRFIPALTPEKFGTTVDQIHWTKQTGEEMLKHWLRHLN